MCKTTIREKIIEHLKKYQRQTINEIAEAIQEKKMLLELSSTIKSMV